MTEKGIVTADGTLHELDVLVCATGFDAVDGNYVRVDIRGRDGQSLKEHWSDGPTSYLGMATSGFPNMFMILGPNGPFTNLPPSIETQVDWIGEAIGHVSATDAGLDRRRSRDGVRLDRHLRADRRPDPVPEGRVVDLRREHPRQETDRHVLPGRHQAVPVDPRGRIRRGVSRFHDQRRHSRGVRSVMTNDATVDPTTGKVVREFATMTDAIGCRAMLARREVSGDPRGPAQAHRTGDPVMTSPDYYLLDELLTDEARAVRDRVRAFVDSDLLPVINDYWDRAEFPWPLVPKLAALGVAGYTIQGYGCPGLSPLELGMVTLELARGDGSITTFMSVQSGLTMGAINLLGSQEQKQRWLPRMAALDKIGAFALTEPTHGSDSVALETTVRRDGDCWVLNGAKRWIGNASIADVIVVWARDVDDGKVKAIVVEKTADGTYPDGYTAELITGKLGKRAVWQPDVTLDNVRVPLDNKLTQSQSFRDATRVLTATRGSAAWESLGHALAAYDIALE